MFRQSISKIPFRRYSSLQKKELQKTETENLKGASVFVYSLITGAVGFNCGMNIMKKWHPYCIDYKTYTYIEDEDPYFSLGRNTTVFIGGIFGGITGPLLVPGSVVYYMYKKWYSKEIS